MASSMHSKLLEWASSNRSWKRSTSAELAMPFNNSPASPASRAMAKARLNAPCAAALTFGLSHARFATFNEGQMQEAVNSLARVFDYYFETGDTANAIAVAEFRVPMTNRRTGMTQVLGKALTLASPGSLAEGRLLSHYGWELGRIEGDYAAAQGAFSRALAIARDAGEAGVTEPEG